MIKYLIIALLSSSSAFAGKNINCQSSDEVLQEAYIATLKALAEEPITPREEILLEEVQVEMETRPKLQKEIQEAQNKIEEMFENDEELTDENIISIYLNAYRKSCK